MHRLLLALAPACLLLAGCSGDNLPPAADPGKGREVLRHVLDSWVQGKKMEDLKAENPPVTAYDPDWEAGQKLVKYEIDPADRRAGVDLLVSVKLSLGGDGKAQEKTVNFAVAIGAQTVVTRKQ